MEPTSEIKSGQVDLNVGPSSNELLAKWEKEIKREEPLKFS